MLVLISVILFAGICSGQSDEIRILIFSKTAGFRHSSIEAGIVALEKLAKKEGYVTEHAEDASIFKEKELKRFNTVIFLNTIVFDFQFSLYYKNFFFKKVNCSLICNFSVLFNFNSFIFLYSVNASS